MSPRAVRAASPDAGRTKRSTSPSPATSAPDREEVGSREHVHMPADEIPPTRRLTPFGSRCNVVAAQDVAHSLVRNMMTQVCQRPHDAVVTPTRVLAGKANHQFLQLG